MSNTKEDSEFIGILKAIGILSCMVAGAVLFIFVLVGIGMFIHAVSVLIDSNIYTEWLHKFWIGIFG